MTEKERIEKVMEVEQMNATQFAAEIGIQSSTLSHILNGRNNPSLDVLKRILERFPTISPDWLILDVEPMSRQITDSQQPVLFDVPHVTTSNHNVVSLEKNKQSKPAITSKPQPTIPLSESVECNNQVTDKKITRILIFYSDNTFEEWKK